MAGELQGCPGGRLICMELWPPSASDNQRQPLERVRLCRICRCSATFFRNMILHPPRRPGGCITAASAGALMEIARGIGPDRHGVSHHDPQRLVWTLQGSRWPSAAPPPSAMPPGRAEASVGREAEMGQLPAACLRNARG